MNEIVERIGDAFDEYRWDYTGIARANGEQDPLPRVQRAISSIIEVKAQQTIQEVISDEPIEMLEPENDHQYPDVTLQYDDGGMDAIDVKTARTTDNSDSLKARMGLGSYAGYFRTPEKESQYTRFPYAEYDNHYILVFIYNYNDDKYGRELVDIEDVVLSEKWKIASEMSGSGSTTQIGSVRRIDEIVSESGAFSSEKEFEDYWTEYGN